MIAGRKSHAQRPLIGVPAQTLQVIDRIPEHLPRSWTLNDGYFTALTAVGAAPVMIPLLADDEPTLRALYERLDGLFLAGGADVDPSFYQEEKSSVCGRTDPDRDRVEITLTRWAMRDRKPVFAVCRGMQVVNVACGGSLVQDLPSAGRFISHDHVPQQDFAAENIVHDVDVQAASRLAAIYEAARITVNSLHHQGISRLGTGLRATVHAPDGLIEGIEGTDGGFLVAVQWHPEMLIDHDAATRRLYQQFCDAAAGNA